MIKDDGNVIHFKNPKVSAAIPANLFTVSGTFEVKSLVSMPDIFPQLGPEQIPLLKNITSNRALLRRGGVWVAFEKVFRDTYQTLIIEWGDVAIYLETVIKLMLMMY